MSNMAENRININCQIRVTDNLMNSFFRKVGEVMIGTARSTGQQALLVRCELPCNGASMDHEVSRTRDYINSDSGSDRISVSPENCKTSKTTGPAGLAGNRGELYGGFTLV